MPYPTRKRPKFSPRRAFSVASRAFLTLALATCAFGAAASAQTISIAPPANSPNTPEGNSGQTNFEFTVSIDQAPTQDVNVTFTVNNGTAVGSTNGTGTDFANSTTGGVLVDGAAPATANTVTFPANSTTSHIIAVPVTGDTAFEADETFSVSLTSATTGGTIGQANAVATIVNDDNQPSISVLNAPSVTEGGPGATNNANFRVQLSAVSGQDVTFTYNTIVTDPNNAGDGINGDADFTPQNNQVGVIQAGQTFTNIAVPIIGDSIDEADGQFLLEISNVTGATLGQAQATGTILDDDGPLVSVADSTASEGDGQIVFRIQLSAPSPQPITVTYRTGSNSAVAGQDYGTQGQSAEVTGSVTFDAFAGDPSTGTAPFIDVPIPILQDNISEPTEIFSFTLLTADNSASLTGTGARRQATGTITDDDGSPNLVLTAVSPSGTIEGNQGTNTNAMFQVTLSNPSSRTITFRYETIAGTATAGTDFTARSGTVTIAALSTTPATISIPIIGDNIDEDDETFSVHIFAASPSDVTINGGTDQTITGTILDDDGPIASVVPTNVNVNEGDNGARTATAFTVQLNTTSTQTVTVTYTLGGAGGTGNTDATRGTDYTSAAATGVLTFAPGSTTQQVPITILGDNIKEANETITITLSAPTGGSIGTGTGTITIIDDDAIPVINLTGPAPTREGSTGGTTRFVFSAKLDRASSVPITVNYAVNDGTAVAGSDFTNPAANGNNQLVFPAGTTGPQTIVVPVTADRLNEDDETFSVTLSGASASARIGVGTATATILNDDALPSLRISDNTGELETGPPPPQGQQQGPRIEQFQVTLSAPSGKDVTFNYQTIGAATGNRFTALSGVDFQPGSGQLTIPAGQTSPTQPLAVTIISDNLDEDDETFGVTLSSVVNATVSRGGATGTIVDDDNPPTIKITAPDANNTAIEPYSTAVGQPPTNGRNAIFPVTLSAASGRTVTVRYTISGGNNPAAFNDDFLNSASDTTRIFQSGTLTFTPVNGVTPTTQNIVLFPRGDDGDEPDQNYVVNITATNANFAAAADATAGSTIADRDPNFNNFSPAVGYESFGNTDGTIVTLTGNQFITDGITRVQAVRFTGSDGVNREANILTLTADTITFRLPANSYTSTITVLLTSGRVLNSTDAGSRRLFYAQPIVTDFSPQQGVPAVTAVTITGRHFKDPRNPVREVRFNGVLSTADTADRGFTIVSDTQIIAYVPRNAGSGPITIGTANSGTGPPSQNTFVVNGFNQGGIQFVAADTSPIYENAEATIRSDNGQILNPVRQFNLQLTPATQNNGNNTPIAPRNSVDVTLTLTAAVPGNNAQARPLIQLNPNSRIDGVTLVRSSGNSFTLRIAAGRDPNLTIPVIITYAGDDTAPPAAQGSLSGATDPVTGITIPAINSGVTMTLRAEITASRDTELYPNNAFQELQFQRLDIHTFATDTGTALRTTEDQNSPNNRADFAIGLANLDFPNPDPATPNGRTVTNPINDDARPKADVVVTFTSSRVDEGQLTYYVLVNGQKVYPSGAQPSNKPIQVIYATSPTRAEYYRNPHYVEVVGQDDQLQDGDQQYVVTATAAASKDPEYNIPLTLPFVFVNTDNEQNQTSGAGYNFSKTTLNTNEDGQEDVFTTFLRTKPTGNVTINLQSNRTDEVLFVNPNNPTGPLVDNLNITYLATGTGDGKTTTLYRTPLVIRVRGVDDQLRDGDQQSTITTSVVTSADPVYGSIDPPDLTDINVDNESNGVTVFPSNLTVNENATTTFTVRLNARPTSNVVITLSSSDPNTVSLVSSPTLTFTSDNYNTPQTVTVRGVPDGTFIAQRTATIITSPASSADAAFNNLTVADVGVTVFNNDSAFVVNAPSGGLSTSEGGKNDVFTVSLGQAPTATVTLILSANPASEARLSLTSGAVAPSVTLTFTPANYATPQTVNVIGQDDLVADGDRAFTILGRVQTTDPLYAQQPFPALAGINADNETGTGGGGGGNATAPTFAANSTYTFSTPYTTTAASSTISVRSLFNESATDFKIYRFDVANQVNSRLIGEDFKLVPSTGTLQRGVGYILQTGATALTLKTPTAVKAFTGTTFSIALTRNTKFVDTTGQTNANNGLNFIGFPFDPSQFSSVSFTTATVKSGTDTYASIRDAAAAGVISDKLYTTDAKGQLTEVPAGSQVLRPFGAYFVRIYRDNVTLTFNSPAVN